MRVFGRRIETGNAGLTDLGPTSKARMWPVAGLMVCSFLWSWSAHGARLDPRVLAMKPADAINAAWHSRELDKWEETTPSGMRHKVQGLFGVPVSYEWTYVGDDGGRILEPHFPFIIRADDTLHDVLARIDEVCGDLLNVELVDGVICIRPPSEATGTFSSLESRVSFEVTNVSTWEALKQLSMAINRLSDNVRQFQVGPQALDMGGTPPDLFMIDDSISFVAANDSVRDVILDIVRKAPLPISYRYQYYPPSEPGSRNGEDSIWIDAFLDGEVFACEECPHPRSMRWWGMQIVEGMLYRNTQFLCIVDGHEILLRMDEICARFGTLVEIVARGRTQDGIITADWLRETYPVNENDDGPEYIDLTIPCENLGFITETKNP